MKKRNLGLTAAVGSYLLWGLLPVYWKQLSAVSAYEILSHRIIWSFFFMLMILSFMGRMVSFGRNVSIFGRIKAGVLSLLWHLFLLRQTGAFSSGR